MDFFRDLPGTLYVRCHYILNPLGGGALRFGATVGQVRKLAGSGATIRFYGGPVGKERAEERFVLSGEFHHYEAVPNPPQGMLPHRYFAETQAGLTLPSELPPGVVWS